MSEHPNAAVVRSAYEAVERGDMAAFAAALDDDIVWHESMPGFEGDYHGRDGVVAFLGRVSSRLVGRLRCRFVRWFSSEVVPGGRGQTLGVGR